MLKREADETPPSPSKSRKQAAPKRHPLAWLRYTFDPSAGEAQAELAHVCRAMEHVFEQIARNQARLQLRTLPGKNLGVFATEPLRQGDLLATYDGRVHASTARLADASCSIDIGNGLMVDALEKPPGRVTGAHFNHCCPGEDGPNCEYLQIRSPLPDGGAGRLTVVVIRVMADVAAGSELTVDYGDAYFNGGSAPCLCRGEMPCPKGRRF